MTQTSTIIAAAVCAAIVLPGAALAANNDCRKIDMKDDWYLQTTLDGRPAFCFVELNKQGKVLDGSCITSLSDDYRKHYALTGRIDTDPNCSMSASIELERNDKTTRYEHFRGRMSPTGEFFTFTAAENGDKNALLINVLGHRTKE